MDRRSTAVMSLSILLALVLVLPLAAVAKGPPIRVETTNNLSYPAIAVDGFGITQLVAPSFVDPYTGTYPGLTEAEIAALGTVPWYPQKDPDGDGIINRWQADYVSQTSVDVDWVDWGDNIEAVNAYVRRPFRLEVVLFKDLVTPMTGYTMALLENPSSPDEIQGTDTTTYEGTSATIVSGKPKLVIQHLGTADPALTWDASQSRWVREDLSVPAVTPIGFAPELNVGGKYIYGASTGGWKPTVTGLYRVTFYIPSDSNVNLALAQIVVPDEEEEEVTVAAEPGGGATPVLDPANNLTYVDILVQPRNK